MRLARISHSWRYGLALVSNLASAEASGGNQEESTKQEEISFVQDIENRIVKFFLDLVVLVALKNQNGLTGYDIMIGAKKRFDTLVSPGAIYPILYSLERKGLVKGVSDGKKTSYVLSDKGEEYLNVFKGSRKELTEFMMEFFNF
jgi:DNA-binding PadR family transcriptional regulator